MPRSHDRIHTTDICHLWLSVTGHLSVFHQLSGKVKQVEGIINVLLINKFECLSDKQVESLFTPRVMRCYWRIS
jgi:hypothetical protein